jgi:hypothetical protein
MKIEIGQLFRKISAPSIVWEIIENGIDRDGISHVRLLSTIDQTHSILIAESVVMHSRSFALVDRGRRAVR